MGDVTDGQPAISQGWKHRIGSFVALSSRYDLQRVILTDDVTILHFLIDQSVIFILLLDFHSNGPRPKLGTICKRRGVSAIEIGYVRNATVIGTYEKRLSRFFM